MKKTSKNCKLGLPDCVSCSPVIVVKQKNNKNYFLKTLESFYYIFAIVYTFKVWGLGWGLLSFILPIFPIIDYATYLVNLITK